MDVSYGAPPRHSDTAAALFSRVFMNHPRDVGESYWEHQRRALTFGSSLLVAGAACLVHALVPALCTRTASSAVARLHSQLLLSGRLTSST
jgi:hypothetical protein